MALKHVLLGTAVAVVASTGAAQAGTVMPDGWYVSLAAGANWIQDGNVHYSCCGTNYNYSWDTGYVVTAAVGYHFTDHWRAEIEVAYRRNDGDSSGFGSTTSARVWELSEMVNVFYDFALGGRWSASLGAGIGGNLVAWNWPGYPTGDDYVFAGQLIAQLGYQFAERWQIYADYHFMIMSDPDFSELTGWPDSMEKTDHAVMIGIRFDLQSDHRAAPPPPEAPPPPMAPERPREFIVFFGFNKANLTDEAQRVVHEAADAAHQYGTATIIVVGHTDTSGSKSYNLRLSLRRSGAVKTGLAQEGIAPDMIQTSGKGETELMVQTGDGVKEPQNRRATISLH